MGRRISGTFVTLFAITFMAGFTAVTSASAEPDPDYDSSTPVGWHWWINISEAEINEKRKKERLIDIERAAPGSGLFNAVLVRNKGKHARRHEWWFGKTRNETVALTDAFKGRITDLEPYTSSRGRVFAFSMVKNVGPASKGWWWNYDLTAAQVTADIDKHKLRLIDLEVYRVDGRTRYAYVGILNTGADAKAWWWYHNVSGEYLTDEINKNKGRLIDIEVHDNGNLSAVMVKNDGTAWWWGYGMTFEGLGEAAALTASRFTDIEAYGSGRSKRYAFVSIDNANEETQRLRSLMYQVYDKPDFGDKVIRGFYVKHVDGRVVADLAGGLRFQPLSTLKLLPYYHAFVEIDIGNESLSGTTVSWTEQMGDEYAGCLTPGAPGTQTDSALMEDLLPTMMWESHGRSLDVLLDRYGPTNITARAQQSGMTNTEMYFGCPQPNGPAAPWAANRSTLHDLGHMMEGVETRDLVSLASSRQGFLDNMINLDYAGTGYMSPVTGTTTGPFNNGFLRTLVQDEAGPAKLAIVEQFLQGVVIRGKGGSGGPSGSDVGYVDFLLVTLPYKEGGNVVSKSYVAGWFVNRLAFPTGCPDSMANDGGTCQAIWKSENDALNNFRTEIHRVPIRKALATW